jgi:hypothetical protein
MAPRLLAHQREKPFGRTTPAQYLLLTCIKGKLGQTLPLAAAKGPRQEDPRKTDLFNT